MESQHKKYGKSTSATVSKGDFHEALAELVGISKAIKTLRTYAGAFAQYDINLLLTGETGTGKDLLAELIHSQSPRKNLVLQYINCAAIPHDLLESELFGHEKGAFTGATHSQEGKLEVANGSTAFLDEIGELPLNLQSKLLRFLQNGEIQPVGSPYSRTLNVRILSGTNKDLASEVKKGTFRLDLFHRLNGFPLYIPPLRERKEDLEVLVPYLVKKYESKFELSGVGISKNAWQKLNRYDWPGNVRELEYVVQRALVHAKVITNGSGTSNITLEPNDIIIDAKELIIRDAKELYGNASGNGESVYPKELYGSSLFGKIITLRQAVRHAEREHLIKLLTEHHGRIEKVAEEAGIGLRTVHRKMREYELRKEEYRQSSHRIDASRT